MLFRVCEHYYNNEEDNLTYMNTNKNISSDNLNDFDECMICFEIETLNELKPITLKNQEIYNKVCNCNSRVHKECLKVWFQKSKICPICRISVSEIKSKIIILYDYKEYFIYILLLYIRKATVNFLKFFLVILFIHINFEFYFLIIKNAYNNEINSDMYIYIPYSGIDFYNITANKL